MSKETGSYSHHEMIEAERKPTVTLPENVSATEIAKVAKEVRSLTHQLRQNSFVDDLPTSTDIVEPLGEKESPGPWSTYYFPTRCQNSECDLCAVCGYTTLRRDIPLEEIQISLMEQANQFLDNFKQNVIDKQYGKIITPNVENPIGLTLSPTGSFFAENEFPAQNRVQILQKILDESQKHQVNTVFTAEAHARDISSKTQFNYFKHGIGLEEVSLLRSLHSQIILGFESKNDFIRNGIYNKNLSLRDFEKATTDLQKENLSVGAFVFSGLAPMTDLEAKQDTLESVQYLSRKNIFPVLMFANIQPHTITDVLRENNQYKMLEPFTVTDTISDMLNIVTATNPEANWLIPDPVGGPPDPMHNIFTNRSDTISSAQTNAILREMIYNLRNTRDITAFQQQLSKLQKSPEYQIYIQEMERQQAQIKNQDLVARTQNMLRNLENTHAINNYLENNQS